MVIRIARRRDRGAAAAVRGVHRLLHAHGIRDDFIACDAADFAKDLKAAVSALDGTRTRIKKPVLHAQRLIDGEAKALSDRVMAAVAEDEGHG